VFKGHLHLNDLSWDEIYRSKLILIWRVTFNPEWELNLRLPAILPLWIKNKRLTRIQRYRVQQLLVFVMLCHRLAVAAEALRRPVQDAVSVGGGAKARGGSATTLQAAGHGVGGAAQQEHRAGLPHLTHKAQEEESAEGPADCREPQAASPARFLETERSVPARLLH